jgi:hypothetical protein
MEGVEHQGHVQAFDLYPAIAHKRCHRRSVLWAWRAQLGTYDSHASRLSLLLHNKVITIQTSALR